MTSDIHTFEKGTIAGVVLGGRREAMSLGLEPRRQRPVAEIPIRKPENVLRDTIQGLAGQRDIREQTPPRLWWLPPSAILGSLIWFQLINALLSSAVIISILK